MKTFILSFIFLFYGSFVSFSQDFPFPIIWQKSADSLNLTSYDKMYISPDGQFLYVIPNGRFRGYQLDTINKLDAKTGTLLEKIPLFYTNIKNLNSIKFSPDNTWMFAREGNDKYKIVVKNLVNFENEIKYETTTLDFLDFDVDYINNKIYAVTRMFVDIKEINKHFAEIWKIDYLNQKQELLMDSINVVNILYDNLNQNLICTEKTSYLKDPEKNYYESSQLLFYFFDINSKTKKNIVEVMSKGLFNSTRNSIENIEFSPNNKSLFIKNSVDYAPYSDPKHEFYYDYIFEFDNQKLTSLQKTFKEERYFYQNDLRFVALVDKNLTFISRIDNNAIASYFNEKFLEILNWDNNSNLFIMKIKDNESFKVVAFDAQYILDIESPKVEKLINTYPNPCHDNLILNIKNTKESELHLRICNLFGEVIQEMNINSLEDEININTDELEIGIYFLQIQQNKNKSIIKFQKN